jgi:phosphomannomutase
MLMTEELKGLDPTTRENVQTWLEGDYDQAAKREIKRLLANDLDGLKNSFYTSLSFGTGGLRGLMGVGTNRMNEYTIRSATQGLANYIQKTVPAGQKKAVFIGFDCRNRSKEFSEEAAKVLLGNGIEVYLCRELRPTPFVSFGCRHFGCTAAIMITASHNPPAYNGYKVYWDDGGQVLPPHDQGIIDEVNLIKDQSKIKISRLDGPLLHWISNEADQLYINTIENLQLCPAVNKKHGSELKVVFSNLHGTANTLVPQALTSWGFTNVNQVKEQSAPDGNFPTVKSPNPEERDALQLGIKLMEHLEADILLATDPDTDRVGIAITTKEGVRLFNGNEVAALCAYHVCDSLERSGKLPKNGSLVKTIVTTELMAAIAKSFNIAIYDVLTGFKYIAEVMRGWDETHEHQFLFGGEESYGYLLGTHARDKDAVIACALICEMTLAAKLEGKTLADRLLDLYEKYGVYREKLVSINFSETQEGRKKMSDSMKKLRAAPPKEICGSRVISMEDYSTGIITQVTLGTTEKLHFPKSNVLRFWMEDGTKLVVRPSGTEPKVKLYCGGRMEVNGERGQSLIKIVEQCDSLCERYVKEINRILT